MTNPCPDVETGFVSEWKHFVVDCIVVSMNTLNKTTLLLSDVFDAITMNMEYSSLFIVHCSISNIFHFHRMFTLKQVKESDIMGILSKVIKCNRAIITSWQQLQGAKVASKSKSHIQHIIQRKGKIQTKERQKYTNAKILLHTKFRYDEVS